MYMTNTSGHKLWGESGGLSLATTGPKFAGVFFTMKVRLVRKLASTMNGVDVSRLKVGDTIDLNRERAESLIASGWAEPADAPRFLPFPALKPRTAT